MEAIFCLSRYLVVKDLGDMEIFVGCKILENKSKDTIYIHQHKFTKHLKETFGTIVESLTFYQTSAPPR
jgi:hypothetical protein